MPTPTNHSSLICCAGREPPSPDPDERSPRPRVSPTKSLKKPSHDVSKVDFPSKHLINDKSDVPSLDHEIASNEIPSKDLETAGHDVQDNSRNMRSRMSFTSLNIKEVTKNLKRHLSRESNLYPRRSRSSVGHSEEEVRRRAELRRIRQRRIQEELSHEIEHDDDAESLFEAVDTLPGNKTKISPGPETPLSSPSLRLPQLSLPALSLPRLGPLTRKHPSTPPEHVEFPASFSTKAFDPSNNSKRDSAGTISRRYSSPILASFELSFADPRVYIPARKRSAIPPTPSTPNLKPQRLPSIADPDRSSWRLSFASPNRGEQLRRLSKEHTIPLSMISDLLDTNVAPGKKWLLGQGLRSSSPGNESNACPNLDAFHSSNHTDSQDFGGVDGPGDSVSPLTPHQTDLSTTIITTEHLESVSSPKDSCLESDTSDNSQCIPSCRMRHTQNTFDSIPLSERLPPSWGRKRDEGELASSSIIFPTQRDNSKTSRFDLISLLSGQKEKDDARETFAFLPVTRLSTNATSQTADDPVTSLTVPSTPYARRSTIDDRSILASESESFREREAELKVVQARFASSDAPRSPSTPRSSKFREEFDFTTPSTALAGAGERKLSAFARLTRFATRTFDGTNAVEDLLSVPMPKFNVTEATPGWGRMPGRTPALVTPSVDTEASAQWGKAIRLTAESRTKDVSNHLHLPAKKHSVSRKKSSFGGWKRAEKSNKSEDEPPSAAAQYEKQFQERLAVKEMAMDDWEAEMEATAQKAKAKSRNIMSKIKPTGPDRRFPPSWSRFSSHDRSERSLSAGAPDLVGQHDFAMRISESGERIFHQCREVEDDRHIHDDDPEWHKYDPEEMGLAERIGDKISQTVYHLEVHGGGSKPFEFQTDGRRGSMVLADKLEFPELELLPVSPGVPLDDTEQEDPFDEQLVKDEEEKKQIVAKLANYGKHVDTFDGKVDDSGLDDLSISIADPRFYTDCLVFPIDECTTVAKPEIEQLASPNRFRSKTWHGRGNNAHRFRGRNLSVGTMSLRASTDNYCDEMARMEKAELERLLRSAGLPVHN